MIVSRKWLGEYVKVAAPTEEIVGRLLMAGLNHESTEPVGSDEAIDLEVTSNRADCLGHIGVAREVGVLFGLPLHVPDPRPEERGGAAAASIAVEIADPAACPFYSARVIRGVKVGPSPAWLVERLATLGVASVNNVVDVTNYVMFECGQPLHAFDLAKIRGGKIVVRRAAAGEAFTAINHKQYTLDDTMGVIADAERPVALAGVMGGADTEIGAATTDVLLESAQFAPLVVRAAARGLSLASPSSYRFERTPDPVMVEWASRRAAALILELAGGTLERGVVTAGRLAGSPAVVPLAPGRVAEVLGIDVATDRQREILMGLGFVEEPAAGGIPRWRAASWRRDVHREIDLVEEIARIEGYDRVPEDMAIAARPVEWSARELTVRRTGEVLVAAGLCEAMTRSVVPAAFEAFASPWGTAAALTISPPLVRGADRLRRTLLPSLLEARAGNVASGSPHGNLFEIARAYLARPADGELPASASPLEEPLLLGIVSDGDFFRAKGLAEAVLRRLGVEHSAGAAAWVQACPCDGDLLASGRAAELVLHREGYGPVRVGVVGEIAPKLLDRFSLAGPVAAVELRLDTLEFAVHREHRLRRPSDFPAVQRDLNLVVEERTAWGDVAAAVAASAGELLEEVRLVEVWRDAERLGAGKKSLVVSLRLRSTAGTLSGEAAASAVDAIVAECGRRTGAVLRG
jgi:phenylalanyl-tRNA synthetase beta chain